MTGANIKRTSIYDITESQRAAYQTHYNDICAKHGYPPAFPSALPSSRSSSTRSSTSRSSSRKSTTTVELFPDNSKEINRVTVEKLKKAFEEAVGQKMPAPIAASILRDLDDGVPAEYYEYAIEQTAWADRPSKQYMRAIIKRLKEQRPPLYELE